MLVFRYWESGGNDIVVRVGEKIGEHKHITCGSFVISREAWDEFMDGFCKCEDKGSNKHFQKIPANPGL